MARPRKKPDYDPEQVVKEFLGAVADAFGSYDDRNPGGSAFPGLNAVAAAFGMTALKARKLLITAGVYSTEMSRRVAKLRAEGYDLNQMMEATGLGRASVHSYLPYTKIPYKMAELSANAERIRLYWERKRRCEEFCSRVGRMTAANRMTAKEQEEALWDLLKFLQGCVFLTAKGLKFTYKIRGGEMFVNRKSQSITQATVFIAYNRAVELMKETGSVTGPKQLGTFGASYLYPVFVRIGVISKLTDINQQEEGNEPISDLDNT